MLLSVDQFLNKLQTHAVSHPFGFPTETVYGLAAPIHRPELVQNIFELKKRPFFDPLIVHVTDPIQARGLVSEWSNLVNILVKEFWPGPLTLVLPKVAAVSDLITSGLPTVGLRCPDHEGALQILAATGPLAAPSANRFGRTSPTSAEHVIEEFGSELVVVDGGPCKVGIESTVLEVIGNQLSILRPGAVLQSDIERVLEGQDFSFVKPAEKISGPGQLKHHYMPDVALVMLRDQKLDDDFLELLSAKIRELPNEFEGVQLRKPEQLRSAFELKLSANPVVAARELYAKLREVADGRPDFIYFRRTKIHDHADFAPVMDRLTKASLLRLV